MIPKEYLVAERMAKVKQNVQEKVERQTSIVSNTQVQEHIDEIARE
jgi:hypothetical protein